MVNDTSPSQNLRQQPTEIRIQTGKWCEKIDLCWRWGLLGWLYTSSNGSIQVLNENMYTQSLKLTWPLKIARNPNGNSSSNPQFSRCFCCYLVSGRVYYLRFPTAWKQNNGPMNPWAARTWQKRHNFPRKLQHTRSAIPPFANYERNPFIACW